MKKLVVFLVLLIFPFSVFAYSNRVILGGETLGIQISGNGVLVVGFYKVDGKFINEKLKVGDSILSVGGESVNDVTKLVELIDKYMVNESVMIVYERDGKEYTDYLELVDVDGNYKTGLYVKGSIVGIGTLTYIDPETKVYGALGHVINESKTNKKIEVREGFTYNSLVKSFTRSVDGKPGSKNADIDYSTLFGTVLKNTNYGIFGNVKTDINGEETIEVGNIEDVFAGLAYIYTTDANNKVKEYEIEIVEIDKTSKEKNYYFEVTDEDLLKMSGGIVQGMSGSPIVQNNKIIGAVTRVVVDDVSRGYGINIVTMLEEGER